MEMYLAPPNHQCLLLMFIMTLKGLAQQTGLWIVTDLNTEVNSTHAFINLWYPAGGRAEAEAEAGAEASPVESTDCCCHKRRHHCSPEGTAGQDNSAAQVYRSCVAAATRRTMPYSLTLEPDDTQYYLLCANVTVRRLPYQIL